MRAAIAAMEAVRAVEPRARFVHAEPAIHVHPQSNAWADRKSARDYTNAMYEVWDWISGRGSAGARRTAGLPRHRRRQLLRPQPVDRRRHLDRGRPSPVPPGPPDPARHPRPLSPPDGDRRDGHRGRRARRLAALHRRRGGAGARARRARSRASASTRSPTTPAGSTTGSARRGCSATSPPDGTRPLYQPLADELFLQERDAGRPRRRNR